MRRAFPAADCRNAAVRAQSAESRPVEGPNMIAIATNAGWTGAPRRNIGGIVRSPLAAALAADACWCAQPGARARPGPGLRTFSASGAPSCNTTCTEGRWRRISLSDRSRRHSARRSRDSDKRDSSDKASTSRPTSRPSRRRRRPRPRPRLNRPRPCRK